MPYGMTPYDKESYKESKRRRRQARVADETGRILPFGTVKRRIITVICLALALAIILLGGYFIYIYTNNSVEENKISENAMNNNDELLRVVNKANPLEQDYVPKLSKYNGVQVSSLIYEDLSAFLSTAESDGVEIKIKSAYVSYNEQQKLYEAKLEEFLNNPDYTQVRAQAQAQRIVPQAGQSEAQTGLLAEFSADNDNAESYLERNCVKYGFILRYPKNKESETLRVYNKSIYRYVGTENAVKMRAFDMCLEEYNDYLSVQGGSR